MAESGERVVMMAIDESEFSRYALEWTLENLGSINNSKVVIFTVQPISDYMNLVASTIGVAPPELMTNFRNRREKDATALLEKAKEICANHGVITAMTATEIGEPCKKICEAVEEFKVTLLVVGSHGIGVKRSLLGSVSTYCARNAKSAVLVVKK